MRKTFIPQTFSGSFADQCFDVILCLLLVVFFFNLLIHLSTLIYFNLVAELASDYFLNRKITRFFAGLCET